MALRFCQSNRRNRQPLGLVPWIPQAGAEFDTLLASLFDSVESQTVESQTQVESFSLQVDLWETSEAYEVAADLPGMAPESISVSIEPQRIAVSGERPAGPEQEPCSRCHCLAKERQAGRFARTIDLPHPIDVEHSELEFAHGVLRIRLPKQANNH